MPKPRGQSRRAFLLGLTASGVCSPALAAQRSMSARQAHEAALRGDVVLIDVRTRAEWLETGIGASAHPVSMHEPDFMSRLDHLTAGDMNRAIVVICATGGRSNALQGILGRMGYKQVIDVPEGMLGNHTGKGWIKSGLPVVSYAR